MDEDMMDDDLMDDPDGICSLCGEVIEDYEDDYHIISWDDTKALGDDHVRVHFDCQLRRCYGLTNHTVD